MSSNIKLLLLLFMPIGAAALAIDSFESQWSNLDDSVPFIVFVHVSYSHRSNTMTTHMITKKSLRVSMISHRLRSYAFDISNRWMNNAEKKMKMMRRNGENDMWLLIIFCELFWDTVLLLLIHFIEVFAFERRASWSISRQKGAHLFFGNFPGQKRSFFPHSLLFTSSCVSVLVFFFFCFFCCWCDSGKITFSLCALFRLL